MQQIVLATNNQGKLREFQQALADLDVKLVAQSEFKVPNVTEGGLTFIENALIKARHAAHFSGLPVLADDSGLLVDALQGAPGIHSARYAGENASDSDNIKKLLHELKDTPQPHRTAHFYCALVYLTHPLDPTPIICCAHWQGSILEKPQGEKGFGYDPIFYVPTHKCSAAELTIQEKNRLSHRGQALQALRQYFDKQSIWLI